MGSPLANGVNTPYGTREGLIKTTDNAAMTATVKNIGDGAGNDSGLYLGINKVGFNEAVQMTKTSTEINSTVAKVAYISVSQNVDLDTIETNSNASKTKTDLLTVTGAVNLDTINSTYLSTSSAASTYLTIVNAASTYLTQSNATSTYLTQANAATTYQTQSGLSAAVRAVTLSGLSITGGAITSSDTVLSAFGKLQNQVNAVLGGAAYQGTWNASTNTPSLSSGVGTQGYYYVVSVAGSTNLDGYNEWKVGDWAIFNGTTWDKVDNTDAVSSVDGMIGAVDLSGTYQALSANLTTWSSVTPTANIQTWLATPSSANLRAAVTDETGSGSLVFATSPTLVTPTLGVASATSINKVTITAPATGSTLTIQDGFTLTVTGNASVTGTNSGNETQSSINALAITTVGTVGTGTWNATAISAIKGGTGQTTYAVGDILYASSTTALSKLAAGTDTYVLTMSGGVPTWAAGGGGGGSSSLDGVTAAGGSATRNHANNVIEWQWNSMVTTAGLNFTSSSTALTNTAFTNVSDAVLKVQATGASAASNVVSKSLYVSNIKTGTGSTNYAGYFTTESGNGIASTALVAVGYQGGGMQIGAASATAGGIWSWAVTPSTSNYAMIATSTDTNINATTTVGTRIGGSTRLFVNTTGVTCGNANGVYGKLNVLDTPTASGNLGLICFGTNIQFTGLAAGTFGRPAGTAGVTSNTNGTVLAMNVNTGYTGDLMNLQYYGSSRLRLAHDGQTSINVEMKADVSASAIFQVNSTTQGVLLPRMTGTQVEAISSPTTGMLVYSTDGSGSTVNAEGFWQKKAAGWVAL